MNTEHFLFNKGIFTDDMRLRKTLKIITLIIISLNKLNGFIRREIYLIFIITFINIISS